MYTFLMQVSSSTRGLRNDFPTFTIITVAFIAAAFLMWFFIHKSKEKERLLLIEKGVDISKLPLRETFNFNFPWLKVGIVATSTTIGLGIGVILYEIGIKTDGIPPILMFLFGGIGMIIAHYVDKSNDKS